MLQFGVSKYLLILEFRKNFQLSAIFLSSVIVNLKYWSWYTSSGVHKNKLALVCKIVELLKKLIKLISL